MREVLITGLTERQKEQIEGLLAERDQAIKERDEAIANGAEWFRTILALREERDSAREESAKRGEALREAWRKIRKRCWELYYSARCSGFSEHFSARCDGMSEAGDILKRLSAAKAGVELGEESK